MARVTILSTVHQALDNRIFHRQACSLQQAGHDVTVIAIHTAVERRQNINIIPLPCVPRWQRPRLWLKIAKLARQTNADIYHFHDPELLPVGWYLRWRTKKLTIYDVHEVYTEAFRVKDYLPSWIGRFLGWLFGFLEPFFARRQAGLIFADEQIAAQFTHIDLPKVTLFNFPKMEFVQQGDELTLAPRPFTPHLVHVGTHTAVRGTTLMIEAFHQIYTQLPQAHLFLVGPFPTPGYEAEIQQKIAQAGLVNAVTFTGRLPFSEVGTYLQQAAVGWIPLQPIPKFQKNIPTKLFEYMAYRLPVVSSDLLPVRPFLQHGREGLLVTPDDATAHAQAILQLLQDPPTARAMGQRGQEKVYTEYNWLQMETKLIHFYEKLLSKA